MYPLNLRSRMIYIPLILGSILISCYLISIIFSFLGNFSTVFTILLIAWIISIVLNPVVHALQDRGISKGIAILISFLMLLLILVILGLFVIPSLYSELRVLGTRVEGIDINSEVNGLITRFHLGQFNIDANILPRINSFIAYLLGNSVSYVGNFFGVMLDFVLGFFFAFYFLYEGGSWRKYILVRLPEHFRKDFVIVSESITEGLQGFIKGQTIIALIMAVCTMIVMKALGLNLIVVAGLYTFIAMYFPVIGPPISIILPLLLAATASFTAFIILAICLIIISQVVVNVIQPKVLSKSLGLHPVLVVLAVLIGGEMFGFAGALLALPAASIIQSLLIHYYKQY